MSKNVQQIGPITINYYTPSQPGWSTEGVVGGINGLFLNADSHLPAGFLALGSRAITDSYDDHEFLLVAIDDKFVVPSIGWNQIWTTAGISGGEDGWLFQAIAPPGYLTLGVTFTNCGTPTFQVACVAEEYVAQVAANVVWSTEGIDGGDDLILYVGTSNATALVPGSGSNASGSLPTTTFAADPMMTYLLAEPASAYNN